MKNYTALRARLRALNGYKSISAREKTCITLAAGRGDRKACELLVLLYDGFAKKCAIEFARKYNFDFEELHQECRIALLRAARTWDPKLGTFMTYSKYWLRSEMQRSTNSRDSGVRVPLNAHLAESTREYAKNARQVVSFDEPLVDDDTRTLLDLFVVEPVETPTVAIDREILKCLPLKQREAVEAVFFDGKTQKQIAEAEGVTRQAVSLRIENGLAKLRKQPQIKALR